jgi:hypothetical protein
MYCGKISQTNMDRKARTLEEVVEAMELRLVRQVEEVVVVELQ